MKERMNTIVVDDMISVSLFFLKRLLKRLTLAIIITYIFS